MQKLYYNNEAEVKEMHKKEYFLHILCFLTIGIGVAILSLYQVFVSTDYQRVSISQFFSPKNFLKATTQVQFKVPAFIADGVVTVDSSATGIIFRVAAVDYLIDISSENLLTIKNIKTSEDTTQNLEKNTIFQIITLLNQNTLILAQKKVNWQIVSLNLESKKITILKDGITNPESSLIAPSSPKQTTIAFADCTPFCEVVLFDLNDKKEIKRIPAFTNADKKPSIANISLDFFDANKNLLGYHARGDTELYVIDGELNLLQDIRLDNERNTADFIGYFPATQQLMFRLIEKNHLYDQLVLYAADRPSLHLLQKIDSSQTVVALPAANGYAVEKDVFSLDVKTVITLDTQNKTIFSVY